MGTKTSLIDHHWLQRDLVVVGLPACLSPCGLFLFEFLKCLTQDQTYVSDDADEYPKRGIT